MKFPNVRRLSLPLADLRSDPRHPRAADRAAVVYRRRPPDGVVAWTWFTLYGVTRSLAEIWRQTDHRGRAVYRRPTARAADDRHRRRADRASRCAPTCAPRRPRRSAARAAAHREMRRAYRKTYVHEARRRSRAWRCSEFARGTHRRGSRAKSPTARRAADAIPHRSRSSASRRRSRARRVARRARRRHRRHRRKLRAGGAAESTPACRGLRKHFIGHVQTNKAQGDRRRRSTSCSRSTGSKRAAPSRSAARALGKPRARARPGQHLADRTLRRRAGERAEPCAAQLREARACEVDGVMAIGPLDARPRRDRCARSSARRAAFERVGGTTLSLGMSGDWREAIASRFDDAAHRHRAVRAHARMNDPATRRTKRSAAEVLGSVSATDRVVLLARETKTRNTYETPEPEPPRRNVVAFAARDGRRSAAPRSASSCRAPSPTSPRSPTRCASRQVVIVNLQGADRGLLQRVVDFTSGVAYTIDGRIQKLAEAMYLVVPPGVAVNSQGIRESLGARSDARLS